MVDIRTAIKLEFLHSGRDAEVAKSKGKSDEKIFRVLPRQVDQTVAAALRQWLPGQSWSEVRRLLQSRQVMLNGNICMKPDARLRLVDVVKILSQPVAPPPSELDVRIRYIDSHIVVVEKPAGLNSTRHADERELAPRKRQIQPTLDELLPRVIAKREKLRGRDATRPIRAVHRLDRETSGLMVYARTVPAERHLGQQFRKHTIERKYVAVVQGAVGEQTIESYLVPDRGDGRRGSTNLPNAGKKAITHVRPIEPLGEYTLVECRLETGRTHQIRIHLAEQGHPLCGEKVYRQPLFKPVIPDRSGAPRLALCAVELGFIHPITGESMHFEMPLSREIAQFVERLRKAATKSKAAPQG
jgi:23S rRNA pseudouridine1911/1915/1917 synthase